VPEIERSPGPAATYEHDHPPVRDILGEEVSRLSAAQRIADRVAEVVGSWPFIITQTALLVAWIGFNIWLAVMAHLRPGFLRAWDPYPFILLNLMLSFQAAYTGPVVMMSQNRQAQKDRLVSQNDYEINQKAEREIEIVMRHLAHQDRLILDAIARLEALRPAPVPAEASGKLDDILHHLEQNDARLVRLMERLEVGGGGAEASGPRP
jgi:uncharacterized membrane protein